MMGKKVLIVEDELLEALEVKKDLENKGFQVTGIVVTGEEAVESVKRTRPDLVIMDIKLRGEMDGIAAALKIQEEHDDIPIIYFTAYSGIDTLQRIKETKLFWCLYKPYAMNEMMSTIDNALRGEDPGCD